LNPGGVGIRRNCAPSIGVAHFFRSFLNKSNIDASVGQAAIDSASPAQRAIGSFSNVL
jgi:hypothetical protein